MSISPLVSLTSFTHRTRVLRSVSRATSIPAATRFPMRASSTASLNSRCPIRLPRAPSLPSSTSARTQVIAGPLRIQVAGVELNRLFDILIFGGAVVFLVVGLHLIPHGIVHPDGVPVSVFTHCQIPPKSVIASANVPQWRGYSSASLETASIVVWAFRKSVSPCPRKPPALRAEVTAWAP